MTLSLGQRLNVRAKVYVAAEPIPFFWPMRSFIHHNPLHGLEGLPFEAAAKKGAKLFHGRAFLPRAEYQRYLSEGAVDKQALEASIRAFTAKHPNELNIDLDHWLMVLASQVKQLVVPRGSLCDATLVAKVLQGVEGQSTAVFDLDDLRQRLAKRLIGEQPLYESVDQLYGTSVAADLDELLVKSCLDFFDEGQSVWGMPQRELGLFAAWRELASRNLRMPLKGLRIQRILESHDTAEDVISFVMNELGVAEENWVAYFTRELAHLHGWAGFVRWRSSSDNYHWAQQYPADLIDFLAVRLTLALGLLRELGRKKIPTTVRELEGAFAGRAEEMWLRHQLYSGKVLPAMAHQVDMALARGDSKHIQQVFKEYLPQKCAYDGRQQAKRLNAWARRVGKEADALKQMSAQELEQLISITRAFENSEGMVWLEAMESKSVHRLLDGLTYAPPEPREKRPFVQAMFCIDTRSERIRRHLESVGDYQTFGVAGFFGVPVSFMELGKGSENHLCPVLLTPKNLVLEMTTQTDIDDAALTSLEKALHGLKESVLTPFVTVEAVGLLFGFDMVGKTVAPEVYNRWRKHLHQEKSATHLLIDKLSREQADSVVRAVQRALIVKAVEAELDWAQERINDDLIRALREAAMGNDAEPGRLSGMLGLNAADSEAFVAKLREAYRINPAFAQLQMEHLGRIGFSQEEQANFVISALSSIGLVKDMSRFILVVGHGSQSDNNPYESALDCGACGGDHGLVNARILALMANKPGVRKRMREQGIEIPDDAWFVPAMHNTTTDELTLHDLELLPSTHLIYLDRLRNALLAASRLCAQERMLDLSDDHRKLEPIAAYHNVQRNSLDWSQVRPEWGLSGNAYFIIGRRCMTQSQVLDGRAFLHSYDYSVDKRHRLLESILTGPLVVGQWINMEHYFSTVDNERFGSGSKVYHNVAGRFGVMTGNLGDLRTGLPSQTVLKEGRPYHQPIRLITVIEAPFEHAKTAIYNVVSVKQLVRNGWIRVLIIDPETGNIHSYEDGDWAVQPQPMYAKTTMREELVAQ